MPVAYNNISSGVIANGGTASPTFKPVNLVASQIPVGAQNIRYTIQMYTVNTNVGKYYTSSEINIDPNADLQVNYWSTVTGGGCDRYFRQEGRVIRPSDGYTYLQSTYAYGGYDGYAVCEVRAYYDLETFNMKVNVNNTWKQANNGFVNVNGVWKTVNGIWTNINGVWKKM